MFTVEMIFQTKNFQFRELADFEFGGPRSDYVIFGDNDFSVWPRGLTMHAQRVARGGGGGGTKESVK